jgi:arylsulfatase
MAHYPGDELGCDPLRGCKVHIKAAHDALPSMDFDNIKREPGEKYGARYGGLCAVCPIQLAMCQDMGRAQKLPHRKPEVAGEAQITPRS